MTRMTRHERRRALVGITDRVLCACGKVVYRRFRAAFAVAERMRARDLHNPDNGELGVYRCCLCRGYHVGHGGPNGEWRAKAKGAS